MRIVVTGAAGKIGREIVEELSDSHELTLVDRRPVAGQRTVIMDLTQCRKHDNSQGPSLSSGVEGSAWENAFAGAEMVVHLAENPSPNASHQQIIENNMRATWNVFHAAATYKVRRVIYASSGWAVKLLEERLAPSCYTGDGPKITSEAHPCPSNAYGMGKVFGELGGRFYVETGQLESFLAVRIGWFDTSCPQHDLYHHSKITTQDLRNLFRRCAEAAFSGFHVIYGVSAQETAPYDLSYTRQLLSWEPSPLA